MSIGVLGFYLAEDGRCDRNMFRCENGPCIQQSLRCNGNVDCPYDTSDELDCRKCLQIIPGMNFLEQFLTLQHNRIIAMNCFSFD